MVVIPWKCWGWRTTRKLMWLNYWSNKREFDALLDENRKAREQWSR